MCTHNAAKRELFKVAPVPATLLTNARLATMTEGGTPYGLVESAAVAIEGETIAWCGPQDGLPATFRTARTVDLEGRLVTPGLIDCHTHIVFGGDRAREFEQRLEGASYEEVARAGGGILSTVRDTRAASEDALLEQALPRVDTLLSEGVTTLEIKSGYGLTIEDELKMLCVARRVGEVRPVRVRTTYLAAHTVPPEYEGRADAYIDEVVLPGLNAAHEAGLVDAVDGFCEGIAFSTAQMERVFDAARQLGLPVKLHAEQLSNLGGSALTARYGGLSADHLEYLDESGAKALAEAGTVGVLVPGAF